MSPKFQKEEARRLGPSHLEPRPWESTAFLSAWPHFSSGTLQGIFGVGRGDERAHCCSLNRFHFLQHILMPRFYCRRHRGVKGAHSERLIMLSQAPSWDTTSPHPSGWLPLPAQQCQEALSCLTLGMKLPKPTTLCQDRRGEPRPGRGSWQGSPSLAWEACLVGIRT